MSIAPSSLLESGAVALATMVKLLNATLAFHFLRLICHCLRCSFDGGGVAQIEMPDRRHIIVQLVDEGNACRNIQLNDRFVGNFVEIFDERSQTIAMRRDQDVLASTD